jgi:lipopolysaccharide transport system ATP-binding protein
VVDFLVDASGVSFGMLIKTMTGAELGGASTRDSSDVAVNILANSRAQIDFQFQCRLNPGTYFLNAGVMGRVNEAEVYLHRLTDAAMFRVVQHSKVLESGMVSFSCTPTLTLTELA